MSQDQYPYGPATVLQQFAEEETPNGAPSYPIYQNSIFTFPDYDHFAEAIANPTGSSPYIYSRVGNPTVDTLEQKVAKLEGAEACRATSGGVAAISAVLLDSASAGAHVVVEEFAYGTIRSMCEGILKRYNVDITLVDGRSVEHVLDAVRPETSLIYLESPSSMVFNIQDIRKITQYAREKKIRTAIDNTYATPLYQNPLEMGVDLVLHSCSKYLGGHSDLIGGALCGSREDITRISCNVFHHFSNILAPFPAWLVLRGMRTLKVRIQHHERVANEMAQWLQKRPEVENVYHPGLEDHPQHELAFSQMRGTTGLFSFIPKCQDFEVLKKFLDELKIFRRGVGWGGFESLAMVCRINPSWVEEPFYVVRLFVGLEEPEDLRNDLIQSFEACGMDAF